MVNGTDFWKNIIDLDLVNYTLKSGKIIESYSNLPSSLYVALCRTAVLYPDKPAIIDNYNRRYTYQEFLSRADSFAHYLHGELNIAKNSRVAIMLYNSFEFCVAYLALTKLGAVSIPLPTKMKEYEITSLIDKSDVEHIICDKDFSPWLIKYQKQGVSLLVSGNQEEGYGFPDSLLCKQKTVTPNCELDSVNLLLFTSGTTSQSKGVVLRNYNVMHAIATYQKTLGISSVDCSIIPVPIYHVTGLIALLGLFIYTGGTLYLHRFFDAKRVLGCIQENHVTFLHASPTVFSLLLDESEHYPSLPSLRQFVCGSGNIPPKRLQRIHDWLPHVMFHTVYGLTETSSPAAIFPGNVITSEQIGSSGYPIPCTRFKVVDENMKELASGNVGEIVISGTVVLNTYYRMDTEALNDGWLRTGDLGYFNDSGYLFIVDRLKDMINRGGEKVWSYDIEAALHQIPGILEAAVVGIPDSTYGEEVAALIKIQSGYTINQDLITKTLHGKIASYKIPTTILVCRDIPLTTNGKVDKKRIKQLFTQEVTP